ncbi:MULTISPECIES: DUF3000 domain-containing protein [Brevibacterium]|uniref:DUF3000 domain-containing protein n=1 Tax=Brevibacterium TaxID=1696 RepID=UPI00047066F4|nr:MULTISPECIES: DUF3000 domain-containing protein [Brevibacterium]AZU02387.1 DUF3000 domain-containing protein [Brevibacterium linens]KAB1949479.1 DUF3000 domain-containing protein [Brevibacterium linens ATCC 9172]
MVNTSPLNRIPAEFSAVTSVLRQARSTNNVSISEIPAPARLAPYSYALGAEVSADETFLRASGETIDELATGRIVVLFDPAAPEEWEGSFRVVSYIRAELEHELGNETMLGHVAWSWLEDALDANDCQVLAAGGTTTRVLSESFGTLADRPATIDLELRASWTPVIDEPDLIGNHFEAWIDLLSTVAGLPPLPEGVTALPGRRR